MVLRVQSRPAARGERVVAALIDGFVAAITLVVVWMFYAWLLMLFPSGNESVAFGDGLCTGGGCNYEWFADNSGTGPTFWASLLLSVASFMLMSGALTAERRSPGMHATSTYPVPASVVGGEVIAPPSRLALMARWALVLVVFIVGVLLGGGLLGLALVVLCWAPSLVGQHRSLYDWATRVAVVEVGARDSADEPPDRPPGPGDQPIPPPGWTATRDDPFA